MPRPTSPHPRVYIRLSFLHSPSLVWANSFYLSVISILRISPSLLPNSSHDFRSTAPSAFQSHLLVGSYPTHALTATPVSCTTYLATVGGVYSWFAFCAAHSPLSWRGMEKFDDQGGDSLEFATQDQDDRRYRSVLIASGHCQRVL